MRKKIYRTIDKLQADLDEWLIVYNTQREHQGQRCDGRKPYVTWIEGKEAAPEKRISA